AEVPEKGAQHPRPAREVARVERVELLQQRAAVMVAPDEFRIARRVGLAGEHLLLLRHRSVSRSTWIACLCPTGRPCTRARPVRCIRHDMSPLTRMSGSASRMWSSFSEPIRPEMWGKV